MCSASLWLVSDLKQTLLRVIIMTFTVIHCWVIGDHEERICYFRITAASFFFFKKKDLTGVFVCFSSRKKIYVIPGSQLYLFISLWFEHRVQFYIYVHISTVVELQFAELVSRCPCCFIVVRSWIRYILLTSMSTHERYHARTLMLKG